MLVDFVDEIDRKPLVIAAQFNRTNVIRLLVLKGADVNKQEKWGNAPIHYAARWSSDEAISALVEHGALISITNNKGEKPIDYAHRFNNEAAIRMLEQFWVSTSEIYIIHYCSCFRLDSQDWNALLIKCICINKRAVCSKKLFVVNVKIIYICQGFWASVQ